MNNTKSNIINQKVLIRIGFLYAVVLAIINYLGYLVVVSTKFPIQNVTKAATVWADFKESHALMIGISMAAIFTIPFILVAIYLLGKNKDSIPGRIINLPIVYAFIGCIGWICPYLFELICFCYVAITAKVHMHTIAVVSFLNVVQAALFIGTFAFMAFDGFHRRFVLPKYFPNGKVAEFPGVRRLSTRRQISIFYMSVGVLPIFYTLSLLVSYSYNYGFKVDLLIYHMVFGFIVIGFIMMFIFSRHFTIALTKLKEGTKSIKAENYTDRVDVISCDDFGILADNFNDMARELTYKADRIIAIQDSIIRGMAVMVESNDNNTGGHIIRTSECVKILVNKLKEENYRPDIDNSYWADLIKAAPMHDLGKIAIDDSVLRKPGKFTPEEYEIMKKHAAEGARIVENVLMEVDDEQFTNIAINVAHYHHEKWNGTGYPSSLAREQIPLEARIMALADVFDALVSKRCYKDSMDFDKAFEIIEESLGTHFDPQLGVSFLKCRPLLEELYTNDDKNHVAPWE